MKLYGGVRMPDFPCPANVRRLDYGALPLIHQMHKRGIRVDLPFLASLQKQISTQKSDIEFGILSSIGNAYQDFNGKVYTPFNIGSPDHVARLLFDHLQVHKSAQLQMTKAGKRPSVDDDALKRFEKRHPVVKMIGDWRELDKIEGTYVIPLQEWADSDSRVHTSFSVTTAATGRLASSKPNLQNIPVRSKIGKEVRRAFIASPGNVLVSVDLSQIEMRWAAHRSQDPTMMQVFFKDEDVHTRTACNVFGYDYAEVMALAKLVDDGLATKEQAEEYKDFKNFKRLPCKTVGFGVLYGQTAEGLQTTLEKDGVFWTLEQCEELISTKFFGVYSRLKLMLQEDYRRVRRYERIWCNFGRAREVPEVRSVHKRIVNEGLRKAGNHPEQAGAQGTIKLAMAELVDYYELFNRIAACWALLQVHDELISEVHHSQARDFADASREIMEHASPLSIPVKSSSDVAETWADLK